MTDHKNLIESFLALAAKTPNKRYMTQPVNGAKDEMLYWTYAEALSEAKRMACYLDGLELEAGSRIALCSKNCAWWILADLAIWVRCKRGTDFISLTPLLCRWPVMSPFLCTRH